MALTKEDLQAIGALMDNKLTTALEPISERLDTIEGKQDALSSDIATLNHQIIPQLKIMQEGLDGVQGKFNRLDRLETKVENIQDRLFAVEEVLRKAR
jgi:tetrahydromethanopterin S-methyltransferase subunit G